MRAYYLAVKSARARSDPIPDRPARGQARRTAGQLPGLPERRIRRLP
ncbi:hypothetical protein [Actinoplanes sp. SE50/110]|nr:hypothetical protein [Actinoplanes sp. SE50/110]